MTYEVIARKWRPKEFKDLVGQEAVVRTLRNAIAGNKVAQAYVFAGPRGVGKTSAARIFARALQCAKGPTPDPCGVCGPCKAVMDGSSLDVIEIDAATNRLVEDAEKLRETVRYAPTASSVKVYIIDEVHMLSNHAFNALLKTLEEPPPFAKFVFATTEFSKIPETITSRCQRLEFRRMSVAVIVDTLDKIAKAEGMKADREALEVVARAAEGSLRDAQSLFDQVACYAETGVTVKEAEAMLGLAGTGFLKKLIEAALSGDCKALLSLVQEALNAGQDPARLLAQLTELCRDMVYALVGVPPAGADMELSKKMGRLRAIQFLSLMEEGLMRIRRTSHPPAVLELTLLKAALMPELVGLGEREAASPRAAEPAAASLLPPAEASRLTITDIEEAEPQDPSKLDLTGIRDRWEAFCDSVKPVRATTAAHLRTGRPAEFAAETLTADFPGRAHVDALSRPDEADLVQKRLLDFYGRAFRFVARVPVPVAEREEKRAGETQARKLEIEKEERIREAQKDPLVQKALAVFGGKVVDVRVDGDQPKA